MPSTKVTIEICHQTIWAMAAVLLSVFISSHAWGQTRTNAPNASSPLPEFRIDSKLFIADSKQAQTHNLTLFSQGVVYDFQRGSDPLAAPSEIVVYDSSEKKIVLLDLATERKLEMHDITLLKLLDAARRHAEKDNRTRFLVYDTFKEEVNANRQTVVLSSNNITYRLEGDAPADDQIMPTYFEFLDIFTRLQASDPRKFPPFPRIRLNQSIRRVGWLPTRVDVSVRKNALYQKPFEAHTQHQLGASLLSSDRKLIDDAKKKWIEFKSVSLAEYRGFEPTPILQKLTRTANADDQ